MDISDFYPIAELALAALDKSIPTSEGTVAEHAEAIHALRDFIRAADREREANETRSNYKAHLKEGEPWSTS